MTKTVDPMKGVGKPDEMLKQLRKLKEGDSYAKSYVRGSLQYLERHPPNKLIVPLLRKALEKYA